MQIEVLLPRLSGVRRCGRGYVARCPAHADARPSLSLGARDDGTAFGHCFAGCGWHDVLAAIDGVGAVQLRRSYVRPAGPRELTRKERLRYSRSIWEHTAPASDTIVERYLRSRAIRGPVPPSIRFLPSSMHRESARPFPAMVVGAQDAAGGFSGVQVTWLSATGDGKAPVEPQRKTFGPVSGGAVRLQRRDNVVRLRPLVIDTIVLCEGVETGLSILQATGLPVWATLGTSGLELVQVPEPTATILIAADADAPGEKAARECALRLARAGKRVKVIRPPTPDTDFNDLLTG